MTGKTRLQIERWMWETAIEAQIIPSAVMRDPSGNTVRAWREQECWYVEVERPDKRRELVYGASASWQEAIAKASQWLKAEH